MRIRFLFVFIVVLGLAACAGMPTWTAGGSNPPPLPELGEQFRPAGETGPTLGPLPDLVEQVLAGDEVGVGDVLTVVAPLLPPPWGWLVPLIGTAAVALTKKGK